MVQAAAFPLIVVYLLLRGFRDRRYFTGLTQRFGALPHSLQQTVDGAIWLHAVSVGEVLTSLRLLEKLRAEYPSRRLFVSTTTLAGRAIAQERLAGIADGVFYAPIDYCFAVRRVLRTLRPSVVVVLETEIWPNLYREVKRTGAGLLVVNGRISDRAMPRYLSWRWLFRHVLSWPDAILAQSEVAGRRYLELGAPPPRLRVSGNLKYDFDPTKAAPPGAVQQLLDRLRPEMVWIAASTMPPAHAADIDEDDVVLEAFQRLAAERPRLLLLLVPRRPASFDVAAGKLERLGIPFLRRSRLSGGEDLPLPGVLLVDSVGELSSLFALANVAFMGGTLAERGGHNIVEPALFARPVVVGPHMENFPAIAEQFRQGGGMVEISGPSELAGEVGRLLGDPERQAQIGQRAHDLAEAERGATERAFQEVRRLSLESVPRKVRPALVSALLWPLSLMWSLGVRWKRARAMARCRPLNTPVVSVGGISMGGAGKTPCVLFLAERINAAGAQPAILTRGYRRRYPEKSTILPAGASARTSLTGDEAQLFLRTGVGPLGIGADRYATGALLESRFHADVILLDDGFQHWRLERQLDIVLIDALDPFAGDALFPMGRLREPLAALERADVFLITRAEPGRPLDGIAARLRRHNCRAPIFRSRLVPLEWVDLETGLAREASSLRSARAAAFCGLANPSSFWQTLAELGHSPASRWAFTDHHHYRPRELRSLASQARATDSEVLLTTEKDLVNLPASAAELIAPLRLYWLRIAMVVEDEEAFLAIIHEQLRESAPLHQRPASRR